MRSLLLLIAIAIAGCAQPRPDTHDNFDAWQRSLKDVPLKTLVAAMGKIPDASFDLDANTRILQWRWDTSYIRSGVAPSYSLRNGVWSPIGGVAPELVREGCIAEWVIEKGRAVRYRWEGWGCRAHAPTGRGLEVLPEGIQPAPAAGQD